MKKVFLFACVAFALASCGNKAASNDEVKEDTVAVAVGSLGLVSCNLYMSINAAWVHMADRYAEKGETKNLWIYNWLLPVCTSVVLYGIPAFLAVYFGAEYLENLMNSLPGWVNGGLAAVGSLLPALGIGMMFKAAFVS